MRIKRKRRWFWLQHCSAAMAGAAVLVVIGGSMTMAGQFIILDTIQGSSYALIQGQIGMAEYRGLHLYRYQIEVRRDGTSDFVVFTEQGKLQGEAQIIAVRPDNGVELTAMELRELLKNPGQVTSVDSIRGRSFQSIQAAMEVFGKQNRDLSLYKIKVAWDGDVITVMFTDKDLKTGARGYTPARPGFEVILDPKNLHVLKSYFVR